MVLPWCVGSRSCARRSGYLLRWCAGAVPTRAELFRRRSFARQSYMMPVGTRSAQASAGATRTTPPAYIISCL